MSQIYTTRRRAVRDAGKAAAPARETRQETYYGGFSETDGGMGSQLGELMQARMRQHFLDHQNPAAEREADQLSAGLDSARTPEEVKSRLGERLGADFSQRPFPHRLRRGEFRRTDGRPGLCHGPGRVFRQGGL